MAPLSMFKLYFCGEQYRNSLEVYGHSCHLTKPYRPCAGRTVWVRIVPLWERAGSLPHQSSHACLLARGAQLAFFVRKDDFNTAVLRTTALCGIYVNRVLIAITFHQDSLLVDTQIDQHIRHGLRAITG